MLRRIVVVLAGLCVLGLPATAVAEEGGCANEASRPAGSYSSRLPDCRAYEQVTPLNKDGTNPAAFENAIQASPSGERLAYIVPADMPGAEGGYYPPMFLAVRGGEGWSSTGMQAPFQSPGQSSVIGWSEDLSETMDEVNELTLGSGWGAYLRENASGSLRLVSATEGETIRPAGFSSDDSRLIFETRDRLLPDAAAGKTNLYEWHSGALSLAGVLPDGSTPPGGSFAGPYDWAGNNVRGGGASYGYYTQNTISSDGSRIFFTAGETGQIYVRENGSRTVKVSASQRSVPDPNGVKPAAFMDATPDGSRVFFTSCEKLTNDSTAVSTAEASCTHGSEGQDLYEYDLDTGALTDLTVDDNVSDSVGAEVQGVLGAESGAGGTYVYFVAGGALAHGASPTNCVKGESAGECDLYLWHDGDVSLIGVLPILDESDWRAFVESLPRTSRVSTDGSVLLFGSQRRLTSYNNAGFNEFYRYDATSGQLVCVSCNPDGAPPASGAATRGGHHPALGAVLPSFLTRNLSADGRRVFFQTTDSLLPQDTNNAQDVYEWEQAGDGSCRELSEGFSAGSDGCLYLISSGRSPEESSFADASANGDDVFFFTEQPLVGQDQDALADIYDARVGGGIAAQSSSQPSPCAGEACRGAAGATPAFGAPASSVFSGAGNLVPVVSAPAAKAKKPKPKTKPKKKGRHKRQKRARKAKRALTRGGGARSAHKTTRGSK